MTISNLRGIAILAELLISAAFLGQTGWSQPPKPAADEFFQQLSKFGNQAEKFLPSFIREVSPEQLRQLDAVVIDIQEERKLGRAVLGAYEEQLRQRGKSLLRRGKDVDYLQRLVRMLQPNMSHAKRYATIRVGLIDITQPDAYSIPGGELLFTKGLLESAESEAALVGVAAHELAHLDRSHQLVALKQSKLVGQQPDFENMMSAIAAFAKPFHAEFESQADSDAFRWMVAAEYDPRELARLLHRWDEQQNRQQPWMNALPNFVRTHPDAGLRAAQILESLDQLPLDLDRLYVGRENLRRRLTRQQQQFAD